MSILYPVREASEEDLHFSTDGADVFNILRDSSGDMPDCACRARRVSHLENPVCMCVLLSVIFKVF